MIKAIVWLVIFGVMYYVLDWGLRKLSLPEPFHRILSGILVLLVVLCVINAVLSIVGHSLFELPGLHLN